MKYCEKCGTQIADEATICNNCGCATSLNARNNQTSEQNSPNNRPQNFNLNIVAIIAGVLGAIIGFWSPILGIVIALIGIAFSVLGKVLQPTHDYFIIGLLVSIGGIVASIISWIIAAIILLM